MRQLLSAALVLAALTAPAGSRSGEAPARHVPAAAVAPARIEALSRAYVGTTYALDCLGEACAPDADPLFRRDQVDCQTLVEQVMAEAIAPWSGGLDAAVRRIRYRNGEVALANRYHYCVPDWLSHPWPARDVTAALTSRGLRQTRRRIDLPALLASRGARSGSPAVAATIRTSYVPRAQVRSVVDRIPNGSIALFVLGRPDIVAGHMGFLFRKNGTVTLRHASQTRKKVIDEPLLTYLERAPKRFVGLKVLHPDVNGLRRAAR